MTVSLASTLAASVLGLSIWFGGAAGALYLAAYVLTLVPGFPIGWRLFGRTHAAGWVAGALFGYGLTALALWIPVFAGLATPPVFAAAWLAITTLVWTLARRGPPLVTMPPCGVRDLATLLLLLHLVPLLLALPFGRTGERDATGTKYYRAYFTADFVWHAALTQELARFERRPVNPYLAPEPVHYYWTYFLAPAAIAGPEASRWIPVEAALKINATGTALLLLSAVFCAAWAACGRAGPAAAAAALALLAPSLEGSYEILRLLRAGSPLDALRETNIDAVTAWPPFRGLRIDGLVRSMWWTPQHSTSMALGLLAVVVAARFKRDDAADHGSISVAVPMLGGLALGLSVVMNPFLGAAFSLIYGISAAVDALSRPKPIAALLKHAASAIPVAAGLLFGIVNRMGEGAGGAVSIGWLHLARNAPLVTFVLSFGGLLPLVAMGLATRRGEAWRHAMPAVGGLAVGVGLMYFVSLTDRAWVGFRAGNVLLTTMPMLAACALAAMSARGRSVLAGTLVLLLLIAGAPTTIVDTFNAQDIENRKMGPGFLWTIPITPAQQAGFDWVRQAAPPDAVVQADPIARGRQNWSVIPSFAGRRMAAGLPISLLDAPEYHRRSGIVHALLTSMSPEDANTAARTLAIDLLWIDQDDGPAGAAAVGRLTTRPDLFAPVFRRGDVTVLRVQR